MFMDELEHLDKLLNTTAILRTRRLSAYYEFRDQSEPEEQIVHTGPPSRERRAAGWPAEKDICSACGETFSESREYSRHVAEHGSDRGAGAAVRAPALAPPLVAGVAPPQPIPSSHPILVAGCTVAKVLEAMQRVAGTRAGLEA